MIDWRHRFYGPDIDDLQNSLTLVTLLVTKFEMMSLRLLSNFVLVEVIVLRVLKRKGAILSQDGAAV